MIRRYQKFYGIFIAFLSVLPVFISVTFCLHQQLIYWQMEEALESRQLITLTIPYGELVWHKKNKELIVNHNLFDVKTIQKTDGCVYKVTGLFDKQEQQLHQQISEAVQKKQSDSGVQLLLQQLFSFNAVSPSDEIDFYTLKLTVDHCKRYLLNLPLPFNRIIIPPPKA